MKHDGVHLISASVGRRRWKTSFVLFLTGIFFLSHLRGGVGELPGKKPSIETLPHLTRILAGAAPRSLEELRAMETNLRRITKRVMPSIVGVEVGPAQGSGVIISKDGYVLTAGHVAGKPNRRATVILPDGRKVRGKTLGVNRQIDAGLVKISDEGQWPFTPVGDSTTLKPGSWCLALGHPGGIIQDRKPILRFGRVLTNEKSFIKTDCTLVGGDSGGPLFDLRGRVIGIHSRIGSDLDANIHVPIKTYRVTWDRLAAGEDWGVSLGSRPFIGVQSDPKSEQARIAKVIENSPAAEAGVQNGDTVIRFDGTAIEDFSSLKQLVAGKTPGDRVALVVQRGEKKLTLQLRVGVPPRR